MAKKKATTDAALAPKPAQTRNSVPVSFRVTPECQDLLDELATRFGLSKTAVVEVGARYLLDGLSTHSPAQAKALAQAIGKSKTTP